MLCRVARHRSPSLIAETRNRLGQNTINLSLSLTRQFESVRVSSKASLVILGAARADFGFRIPNVQDDAGAGFPAYWHRMAEREENPSRQIRVLVQYFRFYQNPWELHNWKMMESGHINDSGQVARRACQECSRKKSKVRCLTQICQRSFDDSRCVLEV